MRVGVDEEGRLAKVRLVEDDGVTVHLEWETGSVASVTASQPWGYPVGAIVRVDEESGHVNMAPSELWRPKGGTWIGVVKHVDADLIVVDRSGRWEPIRPSDVKAVVGNTVEVEGDLVRRVISPKPLRLIELGDSSVAEPGDFKVGSPGDGPTFEDFGGALEVVTRAKELIQTSLLRRKELEAIGAKPIKGVLFTGPPGTGKTTLARIVAGASNAEFYEISGPRIFSKYVGDSEELLRGIFTAAGKHPNGAVVFLDEIDSVAAKRSDDGSDVSRRVVAQLLTSMDGFVQTANVVVIAATNRPDDLDPALRRPGRFDWEIEFKLPTSVDRVAVLHASGRRVKTTGTIPIELVAERSADWSPADLNAVWTESALVAVRRRHDAVWAEDFIAGFERVVARRRALDGRTGEV